jgi:hypothetical protein
LGSTPPTLSDAAVLSGGYFETGTVTFTVTGPGGFTYTQADTVIDNDTYTASDTLPNTGTVTGTYTWTASYAGDTNNHAASDQGGTAEQVVVSAASPTLTTTPEPTSVALGITAPTLTDSAVLSDGSSPTGSITFTLYLGTTAVDTEVTTVTGNGTYSTPVGYAVPTTGTVAGTYQWDATYSGDVNNNGVSDNSDPIEQVVVDPATPTVTSFASPSVTLGFAPPTLSDTAFLSDGWSPSGTITFTLSLGTTTVDTETATVNGDGIYSTPTGYTVPTTGTVTGSYQWDVSYSGDGNNNGASDNNDPNEQVAVSPATPTLSTIASPSVTLGFAPPTLSDTAFLSDGWSPTGTITFTLYLDTTAVDTETATVNGDGIYSTPTGYTLPTTGTVTGFYRWSASYSGDANNRSALDQGGTAEQVVVNAASPTLTTTADPTTVTVGSTAPTLTDSAVLSGGYFETGTITFTLYLDAAAVDTETATVNGNGTYSTPTGYTLPTTGTVTGFYRWAASYSGDANNRSALDQGGTPEQVLVNAASPTLTTAASPPVTLGSSPTTLTDSAVLSGGYFETGTITFTLSAGPTLLDTETATVNGNGTYSTPTGFTLPTSGTVTGGYRWAASYSGDTNNRTASDQGGPAEQVMVGAASPTLTTTPDRTSITVGSSPTTLTDTAVLSGGYSETGSITFTLNLGTTVVDTETATVNGDGSYSTPTGYTLPNTGTVTGTYQWDASYSGDTNNSGVSDNNATNEQVVVRALPTVTSVSPSSGPVDGGQPITITGTNFSADATVEIGQGYGPGPTAVLATDVTVVTPTEITATTGRGVRVGTRNLYVVTAAGTSPTNPGDNYTYVLPAVTSVSPNSGPVDGGQAITITGTNFPSDATVEIGQGSGPGPTAIRATDVTVVSPTEITATTGGGARVGS